MDELECKAFELELAQLNRFKKMNGRERVYFWTPREKAVARQIRQLRRESRTYRAPLQQEKLEEAS